MPNYEVTTLRLPSDLLNALKKKAKNEMTSVSVVVRQLIKSGLKNNSQG
jgi:hypothetical protein